MFKSKKGITLIALVITIIVLLILAGTSVAMLTGENGLLTKATGAKEKTRGGEVKEYVDLAIANNKVVEHTGGTRQERNDVIASLLEEGKLTQEEADALLDNDNPVDIITIGGINIDFSKLDSNLPYFVGYFENDDMEDPIDRLGDIYLVNNEVNLPLTFSQAYVEIENRRIDVSNWIENLNDEGIDYSSIYVKRIFEQDDILEYNKTCKFVLINEGNEYISQPIQIPEPDFQLGENNRTGIVAEINNDPTFFNKAYVIYENERIDISNYIKEYSIYPSYINLDEIRINGEQLPIGEVYEVIIVRGGKEYRIEISYDYG